MEQDLICFDRAACVRKTYVDRATYCTHTVPKILTLLNKVWFSFFSGWKSTQFQSKPNQDTHVDFPVSLQIIYLSN